MERGGRWSGNENRESVEVDVTELGWWCVTSVVKLKEPVDRQPPGSATKDAVD